MPTCDEERPQNSADRSPADPDPARDDEHAGAANASDITDREATPSHMDPAETAAGLLLERALASVGATSGADILIVVEVPGAEWVDLIADAWHGGILGDAVSGGQPLGRSAAADGRFSKLRRNGSERTHKPDNGNCEIAAAAVRGRRVVGISQSPSLYLPRDLVRAADMRIVVPPPDAALLAEVAEHLTGGRPTRLPPDAAAAKVRPSMLRLAVRRGQGPDQWLDRVVALTAADTLSRPRERKLADLPGLGEAADWGYSLKRDLADYMAGKLPWSAVDKGVLLASRPGLGKTSFAKALASECGVPIIVTSYAQWQARKEGYLGDVVRALHEAFEDARRSAPCILFIDELDSVGSRNLSARHDDWWRAIINALLEQMDGLAGREGVVIVAATNDPMHIDPAIRRSGRLDRLIVIPDPDAAALEQIMRSHLGEDLRGADLGAAALAGLGGTGADVEKWVRGARRRARDAGRGLELADLLAEIRGAAHPRSDRYMRVTATHESGHAVLQEMVWPGTLERATTRAFGVSAGSVLIDIGILDAVDADWVRLKLTVILGGRAAEHELLGAPSGGSGGPAGSDLAVATAIGTMATTALGMSVSGRLLWLGAPTQEEAAAILRVHPAIAADVNGQMDAAYGEARRMVAERRDAVQAVADALFEREILSGDEVRDIMRQHPPRGNVTP